MSDFDFAVAVDEILWVTPSGDSRDNRSNLDAVRWSLEERSRAIQLLRQLLDVLLPLYPWRRTIQVGPPLLESLLFVQEQEGGAEYPPPEAVVEE